MLGCRTNNTLVELGNKDRLFEGEPVNKTMYQKLVGKIIYLSYTRLDIVFAVSVVSNLQENDYFSKKTQDRTIQVFTNADWAGAIDDRRSISGNSTIIWGNLITWRSKKQNVVARSSAEAEFRAMAHRVCEAIWIKGLCEELNIQYDGPIQLYYDNQFGISIAHNPVQHDRTKHVELDRHFIKEKIEGNIIKIKHVNTGEQLADMLTKGLSEKTLSQLLNKLGLIDIYRPT
ncbi:transmembrane signal receptor [Lithospermum erythrorhizon]|uniref:Transmembrane signal receptor n=1 Tax=Lithospermum erythrorhizon TaxID=34254 RepID=A0AAV3RCT7_LITER